MQRHVWHGATEIPLQVLPHQTVAHYVADVKHTATYGSADERTRRFCRPRLRRCGIKESRWSNIEAQQAVLLYIGLLRPPQSSES